jgi:translation initiation factor IF-2
MLGIVRERSELEALRTRVANQAASLAETVNEGFEGFHMGAGDYVVDLAVPEGPSTAGGAQARQHLRLVPRRKGYSIVIAGIVDPVTSTAELRTFEHVAILHELRFNLPLEISEEEYTDFLAKADVVLNLARVKGTRVPAPPELLARASSRRAALRRVSTPVLLFFVLIMILAAIVVYRVALTLR